MKLAIITHVKHFSEGGVYYGYSAYVREINIWGKFASELIIIAPESDEKISNIHLPYDHSHITFSKIPDISITSWFEIFRSSLLIPIIAVKIWNAMRKADHIHLRCPGSIGLIGCCVQVLFPRKPKTAKYAGNWDPEAKQPLSYRFQKWLLSNTFWTKNMRVLVYGEWPRQSKNIKSFFTASYPKSKVGSATPRTFEPPYKFIFVGSLSSGKRPLYAIKIVELLLKKGIACRLDFYGDGIERDNMLNYIDENNLTQTVLLHGNQTSQRVEDAYKESHFLILPSQSEGWPKVVAEAMFWGVIPMVTTISCVPWMLGNGERGLLLSSNLDTDVDTIMGMMANTAMLQRMAENGMQWAHQYTLDYFENEIMKLL